MAVTLYTGRRPTLSPWLGFDMFTPRLGRIFEDMSALENGTAGTIVPAVNVEEDANELLLTAELPGMRREDIGIDLENNVLTINGEKIDDRGEDEADRRYHLWERKYGSFQRSFTLPRTVRTDEIAAEFEDGVLTVHMPKIEEAKGRRISIGGGTEAGSKN